MLRVVVIIHAEINTPSKNSNAWTDCNVRIIIINHLASDGIFTGIVRLLLLISVSEPVISWLILSTISHPIDIATYRDCYVRYTNCSMP